MPRSNNESRPPPETTPPPTKEQKVSVLWHQDHTNAFRLEQAFPHAKNCYWLITKLYQTSKHSPNTVPQIISKEAGIRGSGHFVARQNRVAIKQPAGIAAEARELPDFKYKHLGTPASSVPKTLPWLPILAITSFSDFAVY